MLVPPDLVVIGLGIVFAGAYHSDARKLRRVYLVGFVVFLMVSIT